MQSSNAPVKLKLPFASSGGKNTIPNVSQIGILAGAASYPDGFPPLTRTPLVAGGVPPSGLDMNGVLFEMTAIARWLASGAGFAYDGAWAADSNVGGYPKGARVMRSDGVGYWLNTAENNTTDPEAGGAGWVPDFVSGSAAVTMTGSNVTLTPLEYGKPIIVITGTLTANLNLIFPNLAARWVVINDTTGAFSITCKTAAGTGVTVTGTGSVVGDGTNIRNATTSGAVGLAASSVQIFTATGTLPGSIAAGSAIINSASAISLTLPAASTVTAGVRIEFFNVNTGAGSILRAGADTIAVNDTTVTSISVGNGDSLTLESNGTNGWYAVSGSATVKNSAAFANGIGWNKLPNGTIIQKGVAAYSAGVSPKLVTVTFPIAFPTSRTIVATAEPSGLGDDVWVQIRGDLSSLSSFVAEIYSPVSAILAGNINWIAIGG